MKNRCTTKTSTCPSRSVAHLPYVITSRWVSCDSLWVFRSLRLNTHVMPSLWQEAPFATALMRDAAAWEGWADDSSAAGFLNDPFYLNVCKIGGRRLGRVLARCSAIAGTCSCFSQPFECCLDFLATLTAFFTSDRLTTPQSSPPTD